MFKRILVPLDGSDTSDLALAAAVRQAGESGGQVRLLHVIDEVGFVSGYEFSGNLMQVASEQAGKVLQAGLAVAQAAGVPADTVLLDGAARRLGDVVAEAASQWPADLVVVGTHGRRGISRVLLGSGAEQIIRSAQVPVLVIRGGSDDPA
jgi:nucleotide-binding universal stress UspA family protein